jgi:glycosyltransferase involved in cell wall biosynthesis
MFSSTIISTINRPSLSRAVESVLDQDFHVEEFEIIVVNDSGKPLSGAAWQKSEQVRIVCTNCRERSVARNTGAAIALGKYFHFLDDDDIMLPGALNALWELAQSKPDANWLYGAWRTVDNDGNTVEAFEPKLSGNIFALLVAGESLPLQASLLCAETFFDCGGFDSKFSACEDRDVGRRMALLGDIASTSKYIAQIRIGEIGSSTNWSILHESDRQGREKALLAANSFRRLLTSATAPYWHGRVARALFASMVWNLKRGDVPMAASRFMAGLAITGLQPLSRGYWRGIRNMR